MYEIKRRKKNILIYFDMNETKNIFTNDEIDKINVHVFDVINFSPIQHTHYLNWYDGTKCLIHYNIGVGYKNGMTISRFKNKNK